jgi:uncharacterized Zn ribbon protein
MEVSCPNCGSDQAYHNGLCYECPECDFEWSDVEEVEEDDEVETD